MINYLKQTLNIDNKAKFNPRAIWTPYITKMKLLVGFLNTLRQECGHLT